MRKRLYLLSLVIFILLFLLPLVIVLSNASISSICLLIKNNYYRSVLGFTFKQAFISMLLSLIVGIPGAWIMAKYNFRFKRIVNVIYYIPFVLPSILVVLGFVIFYGNSGILNKILNIEINILYSIKAVLMAHVFFNFPVVISVISNGLKNLDNSIEEAASLETKSHFIIFKEITLPRILPSILSAAILVFLFCFSSFAIILVLGGGPKLTTIEVEIYKLGRVTLDINKASSLALISMATALLTVFLYSNLNRNTLNEESSIRYKRLKGIFPRVYLIITTLFIILPIISIFIRSVGSYRYVNIEAIINTLLIGILSSFTSLTIAIFICSYLKNKKSKLIELIFITPMAVSSIILGLGYYIISKYLSFATDFLMVVLCHGVLNVPYAIKSILPIYKSIPKSITESAELDGFNEIDQIFKVEIPYLKKTILTTFMFVFALSCGELNSTLMIAKGNIVTISIQIQRMIVAYNYKGACAMGSILILICLVIFYLFNLIS